MQDDRPGDDGEHALQAQQDGHHRGIGVLLREDLQRVAYAAGENTHVQQRQDAAPNGGEVHSLKEEHTHSGDDARKQELQAAQLHAVAIGCKVVDNQNMYRKAHRTHQDQQVARRQGEIPLDAQQIQRHHAAHHRDPHRQADLPLEEQPEHRHQHHIQRRDEPSLTRVRTGHQPSLLEVGGDGQRHTAAQAAQPKLLVGRFFLIGGRRRSILLRLVADGDDHQQRQHGDKVPRGVKGERADAVSAQILRHKRRAPDERGQNREDHLPHLIVFHVRCVLSLSLFIRPSPARCASGTSAPRHAPAAVYFPGDTTPPALR